MMADLCKLKTFDLALKNRLLDAVLLRVPTKHLYIPISKDVGACLGHGIRRVNLDREFLSIQSPRCHGVTTDVSLMCLRLCHNALFERSSLT